MAANGDPPLLPRHKQTTPTPSRPDRPHGPAAGAWTIGKPSGGMVHPAKTTPAAIASGPAERLDNRRPMGSTSRPAGGSPRRRLHARTAIYHGGNSCSHAPAPEVAGWID